MEFPDAAVFDAAVDTPTFPAFASVRYEPDAPMVDDVPAATLDAIDALPLDAVPDGGTVAVGLGSRGIHDIVPVARTLIDALAERGFDPVVVPAMGSHGGATPAGQRDTLAGLGLTETALGCPIDARMDTVDLGESRLDVPVYFSTAAADADGVVVVNRVKPHTNYTGRFESGLTKMTVIGLGKRRGAKTTHEHALIQGYVPVMDAALDVIREETGFLGGIAIVENFYDRTASVTGVPADELPDAETPLLVRAREHLPTLPVDDLDVLVVDAIGKDVSGAGMDTNVIGRYRVLNTDDPATPAIKRIVVRGLTDATHGNGIGIGLADVTTRAVADELDLDQVYTNALTSNSVEKAAIPVVATDDERAIATAVGTIGAVPPDDLRVAWIETTGQLSTLKLSPAALADAPDAVTVEGWSRLTFENGTAHFEAVDAPNET